MEFGIHEAARIAALLRTCLTPDSPALDAATHLLIGEVISAAKAAGFHTSEPHEETAWMFLPARPKRVAEFRRTGVPFAPLEVKGFKDAKQSPRLEFNPLTQRWEGLEADTAFVPRPGAAIQRRAGAAR